MIRAAGIMYLTPDRQALFLQRAGDADHAGSWCIPGGKLEDGETPEQAAFREATEEAGKAVPAGKRTVLTRTISAAGPVSVDLSEGALSTLAVPQEQVDFTTFLQEVKEPFDVEVSDESTSFAWAPIDSPPQPLHPGCAVSIRRLSANELDVARMMAAGELASPQVYENVTLFDIRITGVGAAWRDAHQEFVYRDPENYLNQEFLARCNGLPVIWWHPVKSLLNSREWSKRVIGTVFLPYIKGDEVWAIAKIYDKAAIDEMKDGKLSTSPAVNFADPSVNSKLTLETGEKLLIEGKPSLLDHIAVCEVGVWDKGGEPAGVNSRADSNMTEEERKAAEKAKDDAAREDKAKADAQAAADAKAKADADRATRLDAFLDSSSKLMADMSKRMDGFEEKMKGDKKDAARKDETEAAKSNEAANEPVAGDDKEAEKKNSSLADAGKKDAAKKDESEEEKKKREEREKDDAAKKDAAAKADAAGSVAERALAESRVLRERLEAMERGRNISDADHAKFADHQARADSVYSAHSLRAPRPLDGEALMAYRHRLANGLKGHSKTWGEIDLGAFKEPKAFDAIEGQIYADAAEAARNPVGLPAGELRTIQRADNTGRPIYEFAGEPKSWMSDFGQNKLILTEISNSTRA